MRHLLQVLYRPRNPSHFIEIFAGHTEGSARVRVCLRFLGYGGSHGSGSEADDKSAYVDGSVRPTASGLFRRRIVMRSSVSTMLHSPLVSPVALLAYSSFSLLKLGVRS